MYKELSYQTPEGYTVFTSHYLKNRGTCCKSACLHCPFGFTLKKHGIQFSEVREVDFQLVDSILQTTHKEMDWKSFWPENIRFIEIKGHRAGFFLKNHIIVKHIFLLPRFSDQGLSKEMIESYFFI